MLRGGYQIIDLSGIEIGTDITDAIKIPGIYNKINETSKIIIVSGLTAGIPLTRFRDFVANTSEPDNLDGVEGIYLFTITSGVGSSSIGIFVTTDDRVVYIEV